MPAFGLDIGSHSIKAVELVREGENFRLVAAGITASPPKGMAPENEAELLQVSEAIKRLVADTKISVRNVVVALPESQVFARPVKFPPLTDAEIASAIQWEAEQYIPIPVSDAVIDYQIIGRKQDTTGETSVLLVAAPKTLVEKYMKVVKNAGLNPVAVETELIALSRSIAPPDKTALIIDFGARSTDIAVCVNRQLVFSRSFPTAGEAITRAVAQGLAVEAGQAEEYKRAYGLAAGRLEGKVRVAIDPIFKVIEDELKKAIQFWISEQQGSQINVVVLTGGTAGLPEVSTSLAQALAMEVTIGDPFAQIVKDAELAKSLAGYSPLYAIAVGLAQREGV